MGGLAMLAAAKVARFTEDHELEYLSDIGGDALWTRDIARACLFPSYGQANRAASELPEPLKAFAIKLG